jgi:hypothetical protein
MSGETFRSLRNDPHCDSSCNRHRSETYGSRQPVHKFRKRVRPAPRWRSFALADRCTSGGQHESSRFAWNSGAARPFPRTRAVEPRAKVEPAFTPGNSLREKTLPHACRISRAVGAAFVSPALQRGGRGPINISESRRDGAIKPAKRATDDSPRREPGEFILQMIPSP